MASLYCIYTSGAGEPCYAKSVLTSGQRKYCKQHHDIMLARDASYKARANAYDADPELRAASAAYDAALSTARKDAAVPTPAPYEIPLKERNRIRLGNLDDSVADENIRELCAPYGTVQNTTFLCNKTTHKPSGKVHVTFRTHEEAARALELNGTMYRDKTLTTEWITKVYSQPIHVPYWVYERAPAVFAAKAALTAAMNAARERQEPGILAAEAEAERKEEEEKWMEEEADRREQEMWAAADEEEQRCQEEDMKRAHMNACFRRRRNSYDCDEYDW